MKLGFFKVIVFQFRNDKKGDKLFWEVVFIFMKTDFGR